MTIPKGVDIIDLMIGPSNLDYVSRGLMDRDLRGEWSKHPAEYMFRAVPDEAIDWLDDSNSVPHLIDAMDRYGIAKGMINFDPGWPWAVRAMKSYPERFIPSLAVNPNNGMDEVRKLEYLHNIHGIKAATSFPAGLYPQVPINDRRFYPIYAKCIELDIPIFLTVGVPGPRVPFGAQHVELLDEVCWFFPELKIVTRHGGEPWVDLLVKLLLKYPNLYYSTSAFAPKYYPEQIVEFANTRGADKVMYAGYYPLGLSLKRIFDEIGDLPFADDVWPKFLRTNAKRVLKL